MDLDNVNAYLMDDRAILYRKKKLPFSYDCEEAVVDASTVTYSSIQLAVYMGFSEIYLLGMDHRFPHTIDKNRKITYDPSLQSHFDTRYKDVYKAAEQKKKLCLLFTIRKWRKKRIRVHWQPQGKGEQGFLMQPEAGNWKCSQESDWNR